jgi:hypothetical protein
MATFARQVAQVAFSVIAILVVCNRLPGQQHSHSDNPIIPVIGTVKAISGDIIYVASDGHVTSVFTNDHTKVWKGKIFHDLSLVLVGDDFAGRCREDASGRLVAELIELNVINFFGVIAKVEGGGEKFEMFTNPKADPQSGYEKKRLVVVVDVDTIFTASAKEDLKAGRDIQMVGLDLRNGTVRATRVTIYDGDWPVRMKDGKVIPVTGPPK